MHRLTRYITLLFCFAVVMMPLSCSDDNDPGGGDTPSVPDGTPVDVRLRLQVASPSSLGVLRTMGTRQTTAYKDDNATADEMMKSWVVVAVKSAKAEVKEGESTIAAIYHQSSVDNLEEDIVAARLQSGATYTFYAFANLTDDQLKEIGVKKADDAANTTDFDDNGWLKVGATLPEFSKKALLINGNTTTTNDIAKSSTGIPMSSEQVEYTINESAYSSGSTDIDRYVIPVVRMVAKVRVVVSNQEDVPLKVSSIQLMGLTANDQSVTTSTTDPATNETTSTTTVYPNLMLMPGLTANKDNSPTPSNRRATNLYGAGGFTRKTETAVYTVPEEDREVPAATPATTEGEDATPGIKTYEFYVNESVLDDEVGFQVRLTNQDTEGKYSVSRTYAFEDFTTIARNEIHVLPITLTRYRPEFTVEAFTAIGVVPQVTEVAGYLDINLGTYGAFHLIPTIQDWYTGDKHTPKLIVDGADPGAGDCILLNKDLFVSNNIITADGGRYITDGIITGDKYGDFTDDFTTPANRPTWKWNRYAATPTYELGMGNYSGVATYQFYAQYYATATRIINLTRRLRLHNTKIDFDDPDWSKRWRGGVRR